MAQHAHPLRNVFIHMSHMPALHCPPLPHLPLHGHCVASTFLSFSLAVSTGSSSALHSPLPHFLIHSSHLLPPPLRGCPCSLPSRGAICLLFLYSSSSSLPFLYSVTLLSMHMSDCTPSAHMPPVTFYHPLSNIIHPPITHHL